MNIVIFLLFLMSAAAVRVSMHHLEYAISQRRLINHIKEQRPLGEHDLGVLAYPKTTSDDDEELAILNRAVHVHTEEKTFHQYISFFVFYISAATLSAIAGLYLMGAINL